MLNLISASEMIYIVSGGALNSTHSLTLNLISTAQKFALFSACTHKTENTAVTPKLNSSVVREVHPRVK